MTTNDPRDVPQKSFAPVFVEVGLAKVSTQELVAELSRRSKAHAIALLMPSGPDGTGLQAFYHYGQTTSPEATRGMADILAEQVRDAVRASITRVPSAQAGPAIIQLQPISLPERKSP